ncbi:putative heterokaryon incompatibility protein [Podospora australis]|uniref:Heterokaryon incompatibility protein n=1 Tax=Podospora australis TaxID=1536484 RepID=A0AAN6WJ09_9PEZI|nr:putative heterokaryon incompatibility protein [Podospora australis]
MDPGTFRYQPLTSPNAIRLLVLEPSKDHDAPLTGTLLHTTLEDCDFELIEPYTALSYVWGDPTKTGTLILAGHVFTITATLANALRDLRDDSRPRRIWADALCIDQTNIPERNRQVSLMGLIYTVAAHTVIYLGSSTENTDLVLGSAPRASMNMYPFLDQSQRNDIVQAAKTEILSRPWFFRVWIFQELNLSRDPWVQVGQRRTRWKDFCRLLLHNGPTFLVRGKPEDGQEPLRMLDRMNNSFGGSNAGRMFSLLQSRRGLGATDARDFVFAHMGIAADAFNVGQAVPVDYTSPLAQVFARMAMYILETEKLETLIGLWDEQDAVAGNGLPSWAPDWRLKPSGRSPMYKNNFLSHAKLLVTPTLCLEAENILGLVGHSLGIIESVSVTLPFSSTLDLEGMTNYQETVNKINALYRSKGGVFYRGDTNGQQPQVSIRGLEQEHWDLCATLFHDILGMPRIFVTSDSSDMLRIMWDYLHPKVTNSNLDGRRFAATDQGDVGVVPPRAEKGDHVVAVLGSHVALMLRPVVVDDKARIDDDLRGRLSFMSLDGQPGYIEGVPLNKPVSAVEHSSVIGSCLFDGKTPCAISQLPDESHLRIYALY